MQLHSSLCIVVTEHGVLPRRLRPIVNTCPADAFLGPASRNTESVLAHSCAVQVVVGQLLNAV